MIVIVRHDIIDSLHRKMWVSTKLVSDMLQDWNNEMLNDMRLKADFVVVFSACPMCVTHAKSSTVI